jgi:hypothetical protein
MNRHQIKQNREFHEKQIDRLMSHGYSGSDDPHFKRACELCSFHEKELKKLSAALCEINAKSTRTKALMKRGVNVGQLEMFQ